jgi:hypothetical protein
MVFESWLRIFAKSSNVSSSLTRGKIPPPPLEALGGEHPEVEEFQFKIKLRLKNFN